MSLLTVIMPAAGKGTRLNLPYPKEILRLDKESGYPEWVDTSDTYKTDLLVFNQLTSLWWLRNPKKREQFLNAHEKERVA